MTVLFADLVGFTSWSERQDPEVVKETVDRCFRSLVAEIHRFGGTVDKIVGDGILSLFGAPVAHEDDAERAVRAAFAMQARLRGLVQASAVPQMNMRIGINTGEVLVASPRTGYDYTAMSDVVNVARRLQTMAQPGQVIVGDATRATTRGVGFAPLRSGQLGGRDDAATPWVAIEISAHSGGPSVRDEVPLIGRDVEMRLLRAVVAASFGRRRSHVVLLTGEPGIGKRRLAHQLGQVALGEYAAAVLGCRCAPYGEANVWWPFALVINQLCGIVDGDDSSAVIDKCHAAIAETTGLAADSDDVARTASSLLYLLGVPSPLAEIEPSRARDEAARGLHVLFAALAARGPVVLTVEALHWADREVLALLDLLLERLGDLPLVVVATARSDLVAAWQPDGGRHGVLVLPLSPLDRDASLALLLELVGHQPSTTAVSSLLERAAGNPLFICELAATLSEGGLLSEASDLPASLRGLIAARLDALSPAGRRVASLAAVVGRVGGLAALESLADNDVREALGELRRRRIIDFDGESWSFESDLVREVAYETMTKAEREHHHSSLAGWIASHGRQRSVQGAEQLAYHLASAAELAVEVGADQASATARTAAAAEAINRAVDIAEARAMHRTATRLLDRALALSLSPRHKQQLLVRRARARVAEDKLDLAAEDIAMATATPQTDPTIMAAALTVRGELEQKSGDLKRSIQTLTAALRACESSRDRRGRASALRVRTRSHFLLGHLDQADVDAAEVLRTCELLGDRRGEAWAKEARASIALSARDSRGAGARISEAMKLYADLGDRGGWGSAIGMLSWLRYFDGDLEEAERLALSVENDLQDRRDQWGLAMQKTLLANVVLWRGDAGVAAVYAAEALRAFTSMDDRLGQVRAMLPLGRALAATGQLSRAMSVVSDIESLAPTLTDPAMRAAGRLLRAGVAAHVGDGRSAVEATRGTDGTVGPATIELRVLEGLGQLLLGHPSLAVEGLNEAANSADSSGLFANAGSALALALAVHGDAAGSCRIQAAVGESSGGTYHDHHLVNLATAFSQGLSGEFDSALSTLTRAVDEADATTDTVVQSTARLALGQLRGLAGDPTGEAVMKAAREGLASQGIAATGWHNIVKLAATNISRRGLGTPLHPKGYRNERTSVGPQ